MREGLQKIAIILGLTAILNSGLNPFHLVRVVHAEEGVQSYQSIGNVTTKKAEFNFFAGSRKRWACALELETKQTKILFDRNQKLLE